MADNNYGRNRDSLADIIETLNAILKRQRETVEDADGQLVLPISAASRVLKEYFEATGTEPLSEQEELQLSNMSQINPDLQLTSDHLLTFVAQLKTGNDSGPAKPSSKEEEYEDEDDTLPRGRDSGESSSSSRSPGHSRSSSFDSIATSRLDKKRPFPSVPDSPFENKNRQRAVPLEPPSSWTSSKRPTPASRRRRSDASNFEGMSDSEGPSPYSGRHRAPSNPTSPSPNTNASIFSSPSERGHGRSQSAAGNYPNGFKSPSSPELDYASQINSLQMPRTHSPNGEDDDEEHDINLVPERLSLASLASLTQDERFEALQKSYQELQRKSAESERSLQEMLVSREQDIEDLQLRLEDSKEQFAMLKRDEKEWRNKERQSYIAINNLEADVNKLQRSLDHARSQYQTLQKQFAEQCAESEKYRNLLRARDATVRSLENKERDQQQELDKTYAERTILEDQIKILQQDLANTRSVQADLDGQKQDNMLLKDTIDRLRQDLQELRDTHATDTLKLSGPGGRNSVAPSLSRSLGSELARRLAEAKSDEDTTDNETTVEREEVNQGTDGEDEDVVQTIITRKRKILTKGKKASTIEKEILQADKGVQADNRLFMHSSAAQTQPAPRKVSKVFGTQTDEERTPTKSLQPVASTSMSRPPSDEPPSYALSELEQSAGEDAMNILRRWHGTKVLGPTPGGISPEAIEDWNNLKSKLGVECLVIEKIIQQSEKQPTASTSRRPTTSGSSRRDNARRYVEDGKKRFYNIYNTYVVGGRTVITPGADAPQEAAAWYELGNGAVTIGTWAVALSAWTVLLVWSASNGLPGRVLTPGAPGYNDRALWSSYNALAGAVGEGFDGARPITDTVGATLHVLEKLVAGAANIARRGLPT